MPKNGQDVEPFKRVLAYLLSITAGLGCAASFALTYDKIQVLKNASYQPSCNINPIISCGSVMKTQQASLLGVPNTIFGLIFFSMLLAFGLLLASGAEFKRQVWLAAQVVASVAVVFMHYLFFQGIYRIGAICPWCAVIWAVTIPTFLYISLYNLKNGNKPVSFLEPAAKFIENHHVDILVSWYLIIIGLILQHFWYYWSTLV